VEFIEDFLSILMCEEHLENYIDTTTTKGVTNDDVILGLVLNTSLFRVRGIKPKILGLEIYKNVSISWVEWKDKKQRLI